MQEHSHTDISNFLGLDQRRNVTDNSHVQPECETGSCRWRHDAHFQLKRTSRIPRRFEKRRKTKIVFTFLWWRLNSRIGSSRNDIRQSSHDLRISNGHARRIGLQNLQLFRKYRAFIAQNNSEFVTVLFPTEVSSFDFQDECTDVTVQYKLHAPSLRLFGLHSDVNDAHRVGVIRLEKKESAQDLQSSSGHVRRIGLPNLQLFRKCMEICCSEQFTDYCDANRIVDNEQNALDQTNKCKEIWCIVMNTNSLIFQIISNWSFCAPM